MAGGPICIVKLQISPSAAVNVTDGRATFLRVDMGFSMESMGRTDTASA